MLSVIGDEKVEAELYDRWNGADIPSSDKWAEMVALLKKEAKAKVRGAGTHTHTHPFRSSTSNQLTPCLQPAEAAPCRPQERDYAAVHVPASGYRRVHRGAWAGNAGERGRTPDVTLALTFLSSHSPLSPLPSSLHPHSSITC